MSRQETGALPSWFYWVVAICTVAAVVVPAPWGNQLNLAVFWVLYLSCFLYAPERTLLFFVVGWPALALVTWVPLPGLNYETIVIMTMAAAVFMTHDAETGSRPRNPFIAPVLYYAILLVVSAVLSYRTGRAQHFNELGILVPASVKELISDLKNQLFWVFLAPIAFRLVRNRLQLRAATHLIAWVTIVSSLQSLWTLGDKIVVGAAGDQVRIESFIALQPNLFGGFLALMICIIAPLVLGSDLTLRERVLFMAALATATPALLYTFSRGSWLALLVALVYFALSRGAKGMTFVLAIGLVGAMAMPQSVLDRVQMTFKERRHALDVEQGLESSAQTRVDQWMTLPAIWIEAPLLGHGYQAYRYHVYPRFDPRRRGPRSAHSSIIEFTAEQGLAGLAAYCWLVWALARGARRVRRDGQDEFSRSLASGFLTAIVCLVILDSSGTRFRMANVMVYIWILGGALARMAWNLEHGADDSDPLPVEQKSTRHGRPMKPATAAGP